MDLTKYGPSPYGEKGAARLKGQESNALAAGLRGFLGAEQQGSVMDPGRAGQAKAYDAGQAISALSDLAGLAPAKLLPAAAGILFPVVSSFNKDKIAAQYLKKQVAKAEDMLKQNAYLREIEAETGLYRAPGSYNIRRPDNARWLHNVELDTTKPIWRQGADDDRGFLLRDLPPTRLSELAQLKINGGPAGAFEEIWRQYPQLFHTKAQMLSKKVRGKRGEYAPDKDTATVFGNAVDEEGNTTLNHELSHAIMRKAGQRQMTGFGVHPIDQTLGIAQGHEILDLLRDRGDVHFKILNDLNRTLRLAENRDPRKALFNGWNISAGERVADFSAALDNVRLLGTPVPPTPDMLPAIPDAVPRALGDVLNYLRRGMTPQPTEQLVEPFLNRLQERNLPYNWPPQ